MASFAAYPPHRLHSSEPIPPSKALELLSSYLTLAATDASLHPNALLTEGGPASITAGANIGLALHNLKRVEAGLRGENLGADFSYTETGDNILSDLQAYSHVHEPMDAESNGAGEAPDGNGWQDKDEFEREQEVSEGDIGTRAPYTVELPVTSDIEVPPVKPTLTTEEKAERKRRKKEKELQEKRKKQKMLKLKRSSDD